MADFRKLALDLILADGKIGDDEVKVLQKELWADGRIVVKEVEFLIELRNAAQKKAKAKKTTVNPKFENLFFKAIEENVLRDGRISGREVKWLRKMLFADNKIDDNEKKLLHKIKKAAGAGNKEFEKLYHDCIG
jgi:hypothetical protein